MFVSKLRIMKKLRHRDTTLMRRLLTVLRRQAQPLLDQTGPGTAYPHRAGAYYSRESALQPTDQPTVILQDKPLMTRGAEHRASFAVKNRRGYR